jgi:hypothetical protein
MIRSTAAMPLIPGRLMSSRTTSGCRSRASRIPSSAVAALPTTSMSGSNKRSFFRFSRVSGTSSTISTRIRASAIGSPQSI